MMFDAKELKNQMTISDYKKVMFDLGAEIQNENDEYVIYMTGDRHLDWNEGSPKLYLYKETKSFYSYTASMAYDIIGIVKARWDLEGIDYKFKDILDYISSVIGLSDNDFKPKVSNINPAWKTLVNRYKHRNKPTIIGKTYPKDELDLCLNYYHPMFLNDNISKETMDKFQIGWYPVNKQITIPVFDECGNLKGVHCRNTSKEFLDKGFKYLPLKTCSRDYKFKSSECLYGINFNKPFIEKAKQVLLFESPKSVLQLHDMKEYKALGLFGMNCSKIQRDMIIACGVNEVVICLDKQYKETIGEEWNKYEKCVRKIASLFKGFCKVTSVTDTNNLLDYKDSPTDKGQDVFKQLYKERFEIN